MENIKTTIALRAEARYGYGGKQFIARVVGRHPKFTFEYQFLGKKEGKRGESTHVRVDDLGLYVERDVDSKGRSDDTYRLVWRDTFPDGTSTLDENVLSKEEAMAMAKRIEAGISEEEINAEGRAQEIERHTQLLIDAGDKDPDEILTTGAGHALAIGSEHTREQIFHARISEITRLGGTFDPREHVPGLLELCTECDAATKSSVATPELDKMQAAREELRTQEIGRFLEWLAAQGTVLARNWDHDEHCDHNYKRDGQYQYPRNDNYYTHHREDCRHERDGALVRQNLPIVTLLAKYAGIDLDVVEQERRALLDALRTK